MNKECFPITYHVWYLGFMGQTYNHQTLYVGDDEGDARKKLDTPLPEGMHGVTWFLETWAFGHMLSKEIRTNVTENGKTIRLA